MKSKILVRSLIILGFVSTGSSRMMPLDIQCIEVQVQKSRYLDGSTFYSCALTVCVDNATAVSVTTPTGIVQALSFDPQGGEWRHVWSGSGYASLMDLAGGAGPGFGTFDFSFTGTMGSDMATVDYNPGSTDPYPGYAVVTSPVDGAVGVALDPTLTWDCANGPCGNLAWYLEANPVSGVGQGYEADINDPAALQWAPGCLSPSTQYEFWISSGSSLGSGSSATTGGDPFDWRRDWESTNRSRFTTRAPMTFASATFRNQGANPASHTASPPRLGASWSAAVGIGTGHGFARLYAFRNATSVTLSAGQVLLGSSTLLKFSIMAGPAASWNAPIPYDCALIGVTVTTQAVLFGGVAPFAFTNAQDLVVGF